MTEAIILTLVSFAFFSLAIFIKQRLGLKSFALLEAVFIFLWFIASFTSVALGYFTGTNKIEMLLATIFVEPQATFGVIFSEFSHQVTQFFVLCLIFLALVVFYYKKVKKTVPIKRSLVPYLLVSVLFLASFLAHPLLHSSTTFVKDAFFSTKKPQAEFEKYYKSPDLNQSTNGKNLVIIYAESLEKSFFNQDQLPDLTKDLKASLKDFVIFSDLRQSLGGQKSIDAMVMSHCGIPTFIPFLKNENDIDKASLKNYMRKAVCLGDVLAKNGYVSEFIASSPTFAKKDTLFQTHGNANITRAKVLTKVGAWHSASDADMLNQAFDKYKSLQDLNKKFVLLIETIDTHAPDGHVSTVCKEPYAHNNEPIVQAIHCTSKLLAEFINKIKADKNTSIILMSDHLMMRDISSFYKAKRENLLAIYDENLKPQTFTKPVIYEDIPAIILWLLGINTDIGFGRNVFVKDSLAKDNNTPELFNSFRANIEAFW